MALGTPKKKRTWFAPRFHFPGQRMIRPDETWVSKIDASGENASRESAETGVSTVRDSSIGSIEKKNADFV